MRDALQSAPFDEVFALLKKPLALREALQNAPEPEEQGELLGVLEGLEEAFCRARPGAWQEKLQGLRRTRWEEAAALLEKVWSLKTEVYLLISDLDREEKVALLMGELGGLQEAVRGAPLADPEALRERLGALRVALQALPVKEVLLLRHKAKALRKAATDFWTDPLDEADGLLEEVDTLREVLAVSPLREALWGKVEDLRGSLREIAKKKISVLSYYLWNVLWSPLWKKVGDMQRALWKTPRKEEGVVQEKLGDLEHALDEILEDNLSGLPRILYALPGIVTALQKKVHAVRESLQETPPEMAVALQGKVVAMQEALWKIPFKEAHLMQEDLKAYCLTLQKKVEAWWTRSLEGSSSKRRAASPEEAKGTPGMERSGPGVRRDGPDAGATQMDPVVGGIRSQGVSGVSSPALPNPLTDEGANAGSARCFQYSVLKAIPHSHFQQRKDWYENTDQDLRDYVVQRLVHAIFPTPDLAILKDHQVEKVVAYAKKVEGDVYESTNHWDVYCCLIMVKLFKIEKELREKRRFRLHKQGIVDTQASPVGHTQPVGPLSSRLATPEVPLSHVQDPPGVNQLYPMSIWNIPNSPAPLDPPAASPVNPPVQIHDEEAALTGQDPGSPLSYSVNIVPTVPPVPPQALPGVQSQSMSLGQMGGAAQVLTPGWLTTPEPPPPPCLQSAQGPGTLGEPHLGTRDAASHGLLGKRRRLAEGGWRASPAGPSPSALPDAPAQPSPVTLESLYRSLEDLRISVLRNLGAVHRQVEALEKRINLLERWRVEMDGRQQPQQP